MESLKADLLISLAVVKSVNKECDLWKWHDGRVRYLTELLFGVGPVVDGTSKLQDSAVPQVREG